MTRKLILALDQGTSSSRALLFDEQAQLLAQHGETFDCDYPQPGWVEVDAGVLWQTQLRAIQGVLRGAQVGAARLHAIGLTNQRETLIAWDARSGEPCGPAIVWQCRRTAQLCAQLSADGHEAQVRERSGLRLDPYFSASKMSWMLQQPAVQALAQVGQLRFGTVDSWLIWKLTGGRAHLTDASNASRTALFNLQTGDWDPWLLQLFGVPRASLPGIVDSSGALALTDPAVIGAAVPIAGVAGDQQAALFGQCCFDAGMAKNTYGTGCFLLLNTGDQALRSQHGLLSTVAWRLDGRTTYALEGSVFIAGALIQWLRDSLGLLRDAAESATLAQSVSDSGGVYVVPALVGLGAPHWDPHARGLICGLTRGSTRAHIARAALEAVALQNFDLLQCMQADSGLRLEQLRIDGGMSGNEFLCQIQADLLQLVVSRPLQIESSAFGAALLAGLGSGVWQSLDEISGLWQAHRSYTPAGSETWRGALLAGWHEALQRARSRSNC